MTSAFRPTGTRRQGREVTAVIRPLLSGLMALAMAMMAFAAPSQAAEGGWASPWIEKEQLALRLVADRTGLAADGTARLGLQVRLAPGWTFYWRDPGENGLAPLLDWSGSRNAAEIAVDWPAPLRKEVLGAQNYVYTDEVVLPVHVTAGDAGRPLQVALALDYGVCHEVCVPYSDTLALDLAPGRGGGAPTPGRELIDWYAALVPMPAKAEGVDLAARMPPGAVAEDAVSGRLQVVALADSPFIAPDLFIEGPAGMWFGPPDVELTEDGRRAAFTVTAGPAEALRALAGKALRTTLVDTDRAVEERVIVTTDDGD